MIKWRGSYQVLCFLPKVSVMNDLTGSKPLCASVSANLSTATGAVGGLDQLWLFRDGSCLHETWVWKGHWHSQRSLWTHKAVSQMWCLWLKIFLVYWMKTQVLKQFPDGGSFLVLSLYTRSQVFRACSQNMKHGGYHRTLTLFWSLLGPADGSWSHRWRDKEKIPAGIWLLHLEPVEGNLKLCRDYCAAVLGDKAGGGKAVSG